MTKETLETSKKLIIPTSGKDIKSQEIFESLESISNEELMQAGIEIEEAEKRDKEEKRKEEEKKNELDALQELMNYREVWKEKIRGIDIDKKNAIIEAVDKIKVNIEKDSDGSRLIEFNISNKTYKILVPKLETHTDDKYRYNKQQNESDEWDGQVKWEGMRGYDIDQWENKDLRKYVQKKMNTGLYVPTRGDFITLLEGLGNLANISDKSDRIAMFMYLTGIDGGYYLKPGDNELRCYFKSRYIYPCEKYYNGYAKLFMISENFREDFFNHLKR